MQIPFIINFIKLFMMRKFIEDFEQHKIIQLNKKKNNSIIIFIKFKQIIILYTKTLLLLYTVNVLNQTK